MNIKNNIFVSAVAMIDVDNRILISNRKNRKQFSNYWEFPGGKIENNETPDACLIRELKEEINVDVSKSCIAPIGFSTSSYSTTVLLDNSFIIIKFLL